MNFGRDATTLVAWREVYSELSVGEPDHTSD